MTAERELLRLELENQVAAAHAFVAPSADIRARYGMSLDTVAGLTVPTCAVWDYPLFNRVIGAGVLGPLDERGIDSVVRHVAAKERQACVELYVGITAQSLLDALGRAGFTDSDHGSEAHVLETDRAVDVSVPGVHVRRAEQREHRRFGELVRDGFRTGLVGALGAFFVDPTDVSLRALGPDGAAFIASVDGADAGTGQLVCSDRVGGCYWGSVVEPYRGRGIQKALVAARVREGLARGKWIFISQTDPDSPSGHNLHDLGFRALYRARWYVRRPG